MPPFNVEWESSVRKIYQYNVITVLIDRCSRSFDMVLVEASSSPRPYMDGSSNGAEHSQATKQAELEVYGK